MIESFKTTTQEKTPKVVNVNARWETFDEDKSANEEFDLDTKIKNATRELKDNMRKLGGDEAGFTTTEAEIEAVDYQSMNEEEKTDHLRKITEVNQELTKAIKDNLVVDIPANLPIDDSNVFELDPTKNKKSDEKPNPEKAEVIDINEAKKTKEAEESAEEKEENKTEAKKEVKEEAVLSTPENLGDRVESAIGQTEALLKMIESHEQTSPKTEALISRSYAELNLLKTYTEEDKALFNINREKYLRTVLDTYSELVAINQERVDKENQDTESKINVAKADFLNLKQKLEALSPTNPKLEENITQGEGIVTLLENLNETDPVKAELEKQEYLKTLKRNNAFLRGILGGQIDPKDDKFSKYQESRSKWYEVKKDYKVKENEYKQALEEYYTNKSWGTKAKEGFGKLFGIDPQLPPELLAIRENYKDLKNKYARNLDKVMSERSKVRYGKEFVNKENKEYSLETDGAKMAFGRKFILKPNQELHEIQKNSALSPEKQGVLSRVMRLMSKYKWHTRGGIVLAAGVFGMATGGAGAALMASGAVGARMAAGLGLGSFAGYGMHRRMQGGVKEAGGIAKTAKENVTGDFSLDNLNDLEKKLQSAETDMERKQFQQKGWSVIAGGIAGGAAGYTAGGAISSAYANEGFLGPRSGFGGDTNNLISTEEVPTVFDAEPASNFSVLEEVKVPIYDGNGNLLNTISVKDIKLSGNFADLTETLNTEQISSIERYVSDTASDLLADHPNMSKSDLGLNVFYKLENKFSGQDWWQEAGIKEIDIGSLDDRVLPYSENDLKNIQNEYGAGAGSGKGNVVLPFGEQDLDKIQDQYGAEKVEHDSVLPYGEDTINNIQNNYGENGSLINETFSEKPYTIVEGDTLWKIMESQYADVLSELSPAEQNRVLDQLIDEIRADADFRESIQLDNFNPEKENIDVINPGDEIELGALGERLKELAEQEKNPLSHTSSGKLNVVSVDPSVETKVPIEVAGEVKNHTVEAVKTASSELGFHIKADGVSENFLNQMKEFSRNTALGLLKTNPDLATNPEALRVAVWNEFYKQYPDMKIAEFGFDHTTLSRMAEDQARLAEMQSATGKPGTGDRFTTPTNNQADTYRSQVKINVPPRMETPVNHHYSPYHEAYPGQSRIYVPPQMRSPLSYSGSGRMFSGMGMNSMRGSFPHYSTPDGVPRYGGRFSSYHIQGRSMSGGENVFGGRRYGGNYEINRSYTRGTIRDGFYNPYGPPGGYFAPMTETEAWRLQEQAEQAAAPPVPEPNVTYVERGDNSSSKYFTPDKPSGSSLNIDPKEALDVKASTRVSSVESNTYVRGEEGADAHFEYMDKREERLRNLAMSQQTEQFNSNQVEKTIPPNPPEVNEQPTVAESLDSRNVGGLQANDNYSKAFVFTRGATPEMNEELLKYFKERINVIGASDPNISKEDLTAQLNQEYIELFKSIRPEWRNTDLVNSSFEFLKPVPGTEFSPAEANVEMATPGQSGVVEQYFGGEAGLRKEVDAFIKQTESIPDSWLTNLTGKESSPFEFFKEQKVKVVDFEEFYMNKNAVELKPFLEQNNIEYDTYLNLKKAIVSIKDGVPYDENTTIEDLFAKHLVQSAEKGVDPRYVIIESSLPETIEPSVLPAVEFEGGTIKVGDSSITYEGLSSEQITELHNFVSESAVELREQNPNMTTSDFFGHLQRKVDVYMSDNNITNTGININY